MSLHVPLTFRATGRRGVTRCPGSGPIFGRSILSLGIRTDRKLGPDPFVARTHRHGLSGWPRADDSFLEDCSQDSLLRVLDKLDQFDGRSQFATWATTIAIRVALGQLRRSRWKDVSLSDLVHAADVPSRNETTDDWAPDAQMQRRELLEALTTSIHRDLTDRQRTALLAELKGMPQDEIAEQLGSSRNALYKLTHDARKKLKERLEVAGFTAEDLVATLAK
ncbi:MAG: sigma-70 family RNA polymerase sigma factor [Planctomycetota bacterium]|nr:MAG: sigma-70 family RNA polymerase sigma factor [Planctomycetota bacterium]REK27947.1 MAG: sigma-70 family RNA polymerase sigma factor [Planctomycetota bacterium]REK42249.1 MAG: sigma-70 family RNA polymerase sigma factor [Planctomycetota bacterium]